MKRALIGLALVLACAAGVEAKDFVNWETPHVSPVDITPDGAHLLAVNTADNRLEVFDITSGAPVAVDSIPVGLRPVSVEARNDREAWVVNHLSDSVSIVDLETGHVRATLATLDEPADVVFAGIPERAFVSCSQANTVLVFDPSNPAEPVANLPIRAEDPRALAVSPDGTKVYLAVFESGNGSTIVPGGFDLEIGLPQNVANLEEGPYGGVNPPPNDGDSFKPPMKPEFRPDGALPAPKVSLIVKKDEEGRWRDDNGGDWTPLISGELAPLSSRVVGWDLPDRDIAVIDTASLEVDYAHRLMNIVMAVGVNPATGEVTAVGTDATNEIRYEPNLRGRFVRVNLARVDPQDLDETAVVDLNPHLSYSDEEQARQGDPLTADPLLRERSVGDPRAIVWNAIGSRGYVAGMGSNTVAVIDPDGNRLAPFGDQGGSAIEVGEGPTGLALDEERNRLYVLNKFEASVSVVDLASEQEIDRVPFFDPTPEVIRAGRPHLYDTHETSGLGQAACASCHVDARMDRLAWDLGNPRGEMKRLDPDKHNLGMGIPLLSAGFKDFHPMKGPMTTQTLQDIVGNEPFHWRGDRDGLEEFNPAFEGLNGDDEQLTDEEMQEFEDFLATIHMPPNPYRNLDNSLPTDLELPQQFSVGRFANEGGLEAGEPLPNGNAERGLFLFRSTPPPPEIGGAPCSACHTMTSGSGAHITLQGFQFAPIPRGPNGEGHAALVAVDNATNKAMKVPQLRNLYDKVGFEMTRKESLAGFGFFHDGTVDSLARFVTQPLVTLDNVQEVADIVAFLLSFSGGDLPEGSLSITQGEPLGPPSQDTHAAVGQQVTLSGPPEEADRVDLARLGLLVDLAEKGEIGLVARARIGGERRGFYYAGNARFQSDRQAQRMPAGPLLASARPGSEVTFTAVVAGTEERIGVDRDADGHYDRDEVLACSDPADATSTPVPGGCGALRGHGPELIPSSAR